MMKKILFILTIIIVICANNNCSKQNAQRYKVDLRDSISVNFFLLEDCKICQYYSNEINQIHSEFNDERIGYVGYFPNRYSTQENIDSFKVRYKIPFTLKKEFFQTKTKNYKVRVTPEVVVYNETQKRIMYQGRIDNAFEKLGVRRRVVTTHELRDALSAIQNNKPIIKTKSDAVGCLITIVDE